MKYNATQSIGKNKAIELFNSEWWNGHSYHTIAGVQLFIKELCCPFGVFHEAVEKSLGRLVFTHEFGLNYEGLTKEFLGEQKAPSLQEIIELIPAEKRLILLDQ